MIEVVILEVVGQLTLGHPREIFEHQRGKLRHAKGSNAMEGHHPHFLLDIRQVDLPQAHGLLGRIVHHRVFRILEEVVAEEIEDVVVVILLVEDLAGEDLHYRGSTHFPFSFTIMKTWFEL